MSPTKRSLDKLRKDGYIVCVVEKWVPNSPAGFKGPLITRDAWNFGDLLAAKVSQPGALLIQTTTAGNLNARIEKIRGIAEAGIWLAAGNSIMVHGWGKRGARGKPKRWECREVAFLAGGAFCPVKGHGAPEQAHDRGTRGEQPQKRGKKSPLLSA